MKAKITALLLGILVWTFGVAQNSADVIRYISAYKEIAISEMQRTGVPASIILAQGIHETEAGTSDLVMKSNNHFGIKCKTSWSGNGVNHDDDAAGECFRTYKNAEESYRDHSNFLRGTERYFFLFELSPTDYKGWARGLKKAGYATNPKYPDILIKNIEKYNLQQYSLAGAGAVPKFEKNKYEDDKEDTATVSTANDQATVEINTTGSVSKINGNKYIYATKGTSLLAIATNYDVQLSRMLEYNDLEEDGLLKEGQVIFLQKKSKNGDKEFYVAQEGETVYDVSQKNGVQLQSLLDYNQLHKESVLQPGTKIYLQYVKEASQARETAVEAKKIKLYQVQPKDGLYGIAKKYGVTIKQLKEWNNLTSNNLSVGQQLIVSK